MKAERRTQFVILGFFVLIAAGVWGARFFLSQATAESLKPALVAHNDNVIDPVTGEVDASAAVDGDAGGDESTFANVYLNGTDRSSQVLFYDFGDPTGDETAFQLNVVASFQQVAGDDGFTISYSGAGSTSCADASSRSWTPLANLTQEKGKLRLKATLENTDSNQVCVKIDSLVNGEVDAPGYQYRTSNVLKVYDVWMDVAESDVQISASPGVDALALNEQVSYRVEVSNVGAGDATGVTVAFELPSVLTYISSSADSGAYDPSSGVWNVAILPAGEAASLTVTAKMSDRPVREYVQTKAIVDYTDAIHLTTQTHATGVRFKFSEEATGAPIASDLGQESVVQPTEETPAAPVETETPSTNMCDFDCARSGFYLYIVNPDGTTRDTLSDFARVTPYQDRYFHVSFEDKGGDFDYNDIAFDLDVRDCHNVRVTMTDLNAGWHHQVRANILYDGVVQQGIVLWPDSHEGVGQTLSYDLGSYISPENLVCQ